VKQAPAAQAPAVAPAAVAPAVESPSPPVASAPAAAPPPAPAPTPAATLPAPAAAQPAQDSEPAPGTPRYAGDGFLSPKLADRSCISDNLRLPSQLGGAIPDTVTARVAVSATGQPTTVQVMGQVADPRISEAVRRAVLACNWIPGADAEGKPTALWVVLPIRLSR
jgi:protein TonB